MPPHNTHILVFISDDLLIIIISLCLHTISLLVMFTCYYKLMFLSNIFNYVFRHFFVSVDFFFFLFTIPHICIYIYEIICINCKIISLYRYEIQVRRILMGTRYKYVELL